MVQKMSIIDGKKYSRHQFASYKFRAKVKFILLDGSDVSFDIYTTEENKVTFLRVIEEKMNKDKAEYVELVCWTSKEQDDLTSEFVNEVLKNHEATLIPVEEKKLSYWESRERASELAQMDNKPHLYPDEEINQGRKY